jgi:hypothetical protein
MISTKKGEASFPFSPNDRQNYFFSVITPKEVSFGAATTTLLMVVSI